MLNSDLRLKLDGGFAATGAAPAGNGAAGGLYRELHAEVMGFIENGSGSNNASAAGAHAGLTPEGLMARQSVVGEQPTEEQQAFLRQVAPLAREAGAKLGVSPDLLAAQAALESGWGRQPISNNLFGIKAGSAWRGDVAQAVTAEYEQGQAVQKKEAFRAYPDAAASFHDFTQLLITNPRYQGALQAGSNAQAYAQGLQRGGYATDPAYADKLVRVAARVRGGK
jgi:flagellar protein FlgJ